MKIIKIILSWLLAVLSMLGFMVLFFSTIHYDPVKLFKHRVLVFVGILTLLILSNWLDESEDFEKYYDEPWKIALVIFFMLVTPFLSWIMFYNYEFTSYIMILEFLKAGEVYRKELHQKM